VDGIADAATRETLRQLLALREAPQRPKHRPPLVPDNPFRAS
jgi:hypothetical protein